MHNCNAGEKNNRKALHVAIPGHLLTTAPSIEILRSISFASSLSRGSPHRRLVGTHLHTHPSTHLPTHPSTRPAFYSCWARRPHILIAISYSLFEHLPRDAISVQPGLGLLRQRPDNLNLRPDKRGAGVAVGGGVTVC